MVNKLVTLAGIALLGGASLFPRQADAGSVEIWNHSGSSTVSSQGMNLNHSGSGLLGYDSGDVGYTDPLLGPGQVSWLKTTTSLIIGETSYDLERDNRPSTGPDANAPYTINLAVGGSAVSSSGNSIQLKLIDAANEPQSSYSWTVSFFNGATLDTGSKSSGIWNFSDGNATLFSYGLENVSGNFGTFTMTPYNPIPEPGTWTLFGIGAAVMALRRKFGKKRENEKGLENKL